MAGTDTDIAGNVAKATAIFTEYGTFIRAVICSKVRNEGDIDELTQTIFLSLIHRPIPNTTLDVKRYLYVVISHDVADYHRRAERYRYIKAEYRRYTLRTVSNDDPVNNNIKKETLEKLFTFVKRQLPECEQRVFVLRYVNNKSIREIANEMKIERPSVGRYLRRASQRLRYLLQGDHVADNSIRFSDVDVP